MKLKAKRVFRLKHVRMTSNQKDRSQKQPRGQFFGKKWYPES